MMLRRKEEPRPIQVRDYIGQRYSERERLKNLSPGQWPWRLKRIDKRDAPIFRRVVTDCLVQAHA